MEQKARDRTDVTALSVHVQKLLFPSPRSRLWHRH